jgi:hypothetical protein
VRVATIIDTVEGLSPVRREISTREISRSAQISSIKSPLFCARMIDESTAARRTTRPSVERRWDGLKGTTTPKAPFVRSSGKLSGGAALVKAHPRARRAR